MFRHVIWGLTDLLKEHLISWAIITKKMKKMNLCLRNSPIQSRFKLKASCTTGNAIQFWVLLYGKYITNSNLCIRFDTWGVHRMNQLLLQSRIYTCLSTWHIFPTFHLKGFLWYRVKRCTHMGHSTTCKSHLFEFSHNGYIIFLKMRIMELNTQPNYNNLIAISINLLAYYHECRALIGYATHYLFCDR